MRRTVSAIVLMAATLGLGGCGLNEPTYENVREEVITSMDQVAAVIPDPKEVAPEPEGEPYSCGDPLLLSNREGAFFTGHWFIYVPEGFDIDAFVEMLPSLLGEDWEVRDSQIQVSFANVDVFYKPLGVTVSVEDALTGDRPALELLAISRCGTLSDNDRSPSPTDTTSSAPPRYRR